MNVLYVTSEAFPFASTGGLADVAGSLPQALNREGMDCRIVMPLYGKIPEEFRKNMKFLKSFSVPVAWRRQHCGIFMSEYDDTTYYFIDNEYYFKEPPLYGHGNDGERFAFFSRAALEILPYIDFRPDIINANDWQAALVPIYQNVLYSQNEWYKGIKTVITIHNIAFQGQYGFDIFDNVLGLPQWARSVVDFHGGVNLLKGAIETADFVVTVSPRYAHEIAGNHGDTTGFDFGSGLTHFISARDWKLGGIVNGLGKSFDPATDKNLYKNYTVKNYKSGKKENKLRLQSDLGLDSRADVPLIGVVSRVDTKQKGTSLITEAMYSGILDNNDVQFIFLGSAAHGDGDGARMEDALRELEQRYRGRVVSYIGFVPKIAQRIYAASDIFLVPSLYEPCGLTQLIALKYGAIPVVRETGGLADTITDSGNGDGNGFTFKNYSGEELKHAIERALCGYWNREGWDLLTKRAMNCDYSWDTTSVVHYKNLFEHLLK